MRSLFRLPDVKTHIFVQILIFWALLYQYPFTYKSQIWGAIADPRCTLTSQMSFRTVYSFALWQKKFAVFWTGAFSGVAN